MKYLKKNMLEGRETAQKEMRDCQCQEAGRICVML